MRSMVTFVICFSFRLLWCYGVVNTIYSPFSVSASEPTGVCDNADGEECASLPWWKDSDAKLVDIWDILDCDDLFEREDRPAHTEPTWLLLRGAYVGTVDPSETSTYRNQMFHNGFQPGSVEVKVTEEKGRGVYSLINFKKGDLVWSGENTVCFETGMEYRKYLASIPYDLACDIFEWAYSTAEDGICVDLDEGSFINHSSSKESHPHEYMTVNETPNVAGERKSDDKIYATQDINPGDEILIDYLNFENEDDWESYGLGKWEEDDDDEEDEEGKEDEEDEEDE